jgi:Lon protease-like protein
MRIPDELPILPVRETVLFPGAVLPLTIGREASLALVASLEGEEKLLGVVAQLDPRVEEPAASDLHAVGTVAKLHKTVRMPNGNLVIFLEGVQRIRLVEMVSFRPFLRARVEPQPDVLGPRDAELAALQRNAQDLFRDVVGRSPQLSDDLQTVVLNIDDPGRLADFIAGTLPSLTTMIRQELLETSSVRRRLETLIRELSKDLEVLELLWRQHGFDHRHVQDGFLPLSRRDDHFLDPSRRRQGRHGAQQGWRHGDRRQCSSSKKLGFHVSPSPSRRVRMPRPYSSDPCFEYTLLANNLCLQFHLWSRRQPGGVSSPLAVSTPQCGTGHDVPA